MRRIGDKGGRKDERNTQNKKMGTVEEGESGVEKDKENSKKCRKGGMGSEVNKEKCILDFTCRKTSSKNISWQC